MMEIALAPRGYRELIRKWPELSVRDVEAESVVMDERRWRVLHSVNETINHRALYRADEPGKDTWGPFRLIDGVRVGDCDDYAVHKLRALLKKSFPRGSLLLTVCRLHGQYHCVLLVNERNRKHIILDSRYDHIWRVYSGPATEYNWIAQEWPGHEFWWRNIK